MNFCHISNEDLMIGLCFNECINNNIIVPDVIDIIFECRRILTVEDDTERSIERSILTVIIREGLEYISRYNIKDLKFNNVRLDEHLQEPTFDFLCKDSPIKRFISGTKALTYTYTRRLHLILTQIKNIYLPLILKNRLFAKRISMLTTDVDINSIFVCVLYEDIEGCDFNDISKYHLYGSLLYPECNSVNDFYAILDREFSVRQLHMGSSDDSSPDE